MSRWDNGNSTSEDSGTEAKQSEYSTNIFAENNDKSECSDDSIDAEHDEKRYNGSSDPTETATVPSNPSTNSNNNTEAINTNNEINNNNNTIPRVRRRRTRRPKQQQQFDQPSTINLSSSSSSGGSAATNLSSSGSSPSLNSSAQTLPTKPIKSDVEVELSLTLDNIYNGCLKQLNYEKYDACPNCKGLGCLRAVLCIECKGSGQVGEEHKRCTLCKGVGKLGLLQEKCPVCYGGCFAKRVVRDFNIEIPAGISEDSVMRFAGEGNYVPDRQEYGDLVVRIREIQHPIYKRNGANLSTEVRLSLRDALCGYSLNISHLNGKSFFVKSPQGKITRPNDCVVVKGLGLPIPGGYDVNNGNGDGGGDGDGCDGQKQRFGNLIIRLVVDFPPDNFFPQESIDLLNQILV